MPSQPAAASEADNNHGMTIDEWKEFWVDREKENFEGYSGTNICGLLQKYKHLLTLERPSISIFVPFCGRCPDMKYLYDQGHSVIGLDVSHIPLERFITEYPQIKFTKKEPLKDIRGHVYRSVDGRIRLYCCDLYDFSDEMEHGIQAVWDTGTHHELFFVMFIFYW